MTNPLVAAFSVAQDGTSTVLDWSKVQQSTVPSSGYLWIHLDMDDPDAQQWLRHKSGVQGLVADALLREESRPRYSSYDGGKVLILRGVNLNPDAEPEDMVSIRIWVEENRIISTRRRRLMAVRDIRQMMEAQQSPRTVSAFIATLTSRLTARMERVVGELSETVDGLEEDSLGNDTPETRHQLAATRRMAIILRRYIAPQSSALGQMVADEVSFLTPPDKAHLRETLDQVTRYVEVMDMVRERTTVINDQLAGQRAETMNRNMLLLSVIAAIFLPLSFITGLLGMNVGGIPGSASEGAFWLVCLFMLAVAVGLFGLFRYLKWI